MRAPAHGPMAFWPNTCTCGAHLVDGQCPVAPANRAPDRVPVALFVALVVLTSTALAVVLAWLVQAWLT